MALVLFAPGACADPARCVSDSECSGDTVCSLLSGICTPRLERERGKPPELFGAGASEEAPDQVASSSPLPTAEVTRVAEELTFTGPFTCKREADVTREGLGNSMDGALVVGSVAESDDDDSTEDSTFEDPVQTEPEISEDSVVGRIDDELVVFSTAPECEVQTANGAQRVRVFFWGPNTAVALYMDLPALERYDGEFDVTTDGTGVAFTLVRLGIDGTTTLACGASGGARVEGTLDRRTGGYTLTVGGELRTMLGECSTAANAIDSISNPVLPPRNDGANQVPVFDAMR